MKNINITGAIKGMALLIGAVTVSVSCNKFLDTPPDNRTEVDTEDKVLQLLISAYPEAVPIMFAEAMSDDADDVGIEYQVSDYMLTQQEAFQWKDVTSTDIDCPSKIWEDCYTGIAAANTAIISIAEMGGPTTDKLRAAYGEAHMIRAYQYFRLVQLFCMPYDSRFADTDLGVPYLDKPETTVNPKYGRNSVAFIYDKIEQDIVEGLPYITDTFYLVPKYHFNRQAAHGFAAEFYLFYKKYDLAIQHANEVLGVDASAAIRDVSQYQTMPTDNELQGKAYRSASDKANLLLSAPVTWTGLLPANNGSYKRFCTTVPIAQYESLLSPSILWEVGSTAQNAFIAPASRWMADMEFSTKLYSSPYMFQYLDQNAGTGYPRSIYTDVSADNVLLIRAEAYVMNNGGQDIQLAMNDLNTWRRKRLVEPYASTTRTVQDVVTYYGTYSPAAGTLTPYHPLAPSAKKLLRPEVPFTGNQEAMMHAILHVRRIELWCEGRRWQDVRRYNIEIFRRQVRTSGIQGTVSSMDKLKERDPRMAIQIPSAVSAAGLQPNPR